MPRAVAATADAFGAPSWTFVGLEPVRAVLEYAGMQMMDQSELPRGDGHAVVLFPGLASDQHAIGPLKDFCDKLGYTALDWGRGFNTGPKGNPDPWLDGLSEDVQTLTSVHGGTISLVGWSLGGIYAREVAKRLGPRVRQVVTIGTPFAGTVKQTRAGVVYRLLNGGAAPIDSAMSRKLRTPPGVPTSSIYSRSLWRSSKLTPLRSPELTQPVRSARHAMPIVGWLGGIDAVLVRSAR